MIVTPYEYAKLSQISYTVPNMKQGNLGFNVPKGWNVMEVSSDKNEKEGFFAVAFQKNKEIVVALRGTDFHFGEGFNDIVSNLPEIVAFLEGLKNDFDFWGGDMTHQFMEVKPFIEKIIKQASTDSNITFTGHSLGGAIAQLASVVFSKHATVFDSPGIAGVKVGNIKVSNTHDFDISIFNTAPNLVNTINKHVVNPVALNIESKITGPELIDYIKFCFEQHPMEIVVQKFDQTSGNLLPNAALPAISEWPYGAVESYQFYASYDKRKDVWDKFINDFWNKNTQIAIVSGKEVHVKESFTSFDHFKESFIRRELISQNNNPLKIIQEEVQQLLTGKEGFDDSDLILGLREFSKVLKGDLDIRDAVRTKVFGEIVLKYAFNIFALEAWPVLESKIKVAKSEISEKIDEVERKIDALGSEIKDAFNFLFADKKPDIIIGAIDLSEDL
jgi:hypothetical protein